MEEADDLLYATDSEEERRKEQEERRKEWLREQQNFRAQCMLFVFQTVGRFSALYLRKFRRTTPC